MAKPTTKERLIDTALCMVWQNSYSAVSVDDICKAADVRKGSFYHYFKSKAELTAAAMEAHFQAFKITLDTVFSPLNSPIERFEKLAEASIARQQAALNEYGHVCGCPFVSLGSEMANLDELIREKAQSVCERYESYYRTAILEMINTGQLPDSTDAGVRAQEISSYICGQITMARVQNSLEPLERDLRIGLLRILGVSTETA